MRRNYFILTQNYFFYRGIGDLLPEACCYRTDFCQEVSDSDEKNLKSDIAATIVVDGTIFYAGKWQAFNSLLLRYPDAEVIWFLRDETGLVFPAGREGDILLKYRESVNFIAAILQEKNNNTSEVRILTSSPRLTRRERVLFPLFVSDINVKVISMYTDSCTRTLYAQRLSITKKKGFKSYLFMQFIFSKNGVLWD